MITTLKSRLIFAIGIAALICIACTLITFTSKFQEHPDKISIAIIIDLLIVSPLTYYLIIRKSNVSKFTVLRVLMVGILVATALVSKSNPLVIHIVKTWISPLVEIALIGIIIWKFYRANKLVKTTNQYQPDFLIYCRSLLQSVLGSEKIGNMIASEIAVFYYTFSRKGKTIDYKASFTSYKENGIILVLSTFLVLFVIETASMHFLFLLWNKTAAWILTSLSIYSCLQLFAHIKALRTRPTIIANNYVLIRNGLMGGDAVVDINNVLKIELTKKTFIEEDVVNLAFLRGLENYNIAMYLHYEVVVTKAFGIKKKGRILLVNIDSPKNFIETIEKKMKM